MPDPIHYPYRRAGDWGFRNDVDDGARALAAVLQWRADAIASGWTWEQTYANEAPDRAMRLHGPGGWVAQTLARTVQRFNGYGATRPTAEITVWGPDGLQVPVPLLFDMDALTKALTTCSHCQTEGVATTRVGFAGRYCDPCAVKARPVVEAPGWNS